MQSFTVIMAQIDTLVGDIDGNTQKIINVAETSEAKGCDLILFPELTLTGYPPEDLLLRDSLTLRINEAMDKLKQANAESQSAWVVGLPLLNEDGKLFNSARVLYQGDILATYHKQKLPNYQVFDEHRYFVAGTDPVVFSLKGMRFALTICEDVWHESPIAEAAKLGVDCILNLNASPFHQGKQEARLDLLSSHIENCQIPIVYTNAVGGQDELVFDGGSIALDANQDLKVQAPFFKEAIVSVLFHKAQDQWLMQSGEVSALQEPLEELWQALVLGVKDYVHKNGFKGALLGLSGGIDSALTLAIAAEALGKDNVMAVMMPFKYTSQMSVEDAGIQAKRLGVQYDTIAIEPMYDAFMGALAGQFAGTGKDTTEENIQARARGVLLMAISNKKGYLLLTTGNKSEVSVGYCTLYGDMAGGFNAIKNVPKTTVFALARFLNEKAKALGESPVIPERVIERPPSAELSPDQKDEDSLPPYEVLDEILYRYIECDQSAHTIINAGFNENEVNRVLRLVDLNEYKRRQSAIGVRISQRDFGRDRRYPITNGWKIGK
ncbi:MAG: NAD+ synthase [Cellvibrionales bacterium]|nr:NAD+ synthase [Cellvibrionales bacterium]